MLYSGFEVAQLLWEKLRWGMKRETNNFGFWLKARNFHSTANRIPSPHLRIWRTKNFTQIRLAVKSQKILIGDFKPLTSPSSNRWCKCNDSSSCNKLMTIHNMNQIKEKIDKGANAVELSQKKLLALGSAQFWSWIKRTSPTLGKTVKSSVKR